jgi:hypothetical protein
MATSSSLSDGGRRDNARDPLEHCGPRVRNLLSRDYPWLDCGAALAAEETQQRAYVEERLRSIVQEELKQAIPEIVAAVVEVLRHDQ